MTTTTLLHNDFHVPDSFIAARILIRAIRNVPDNQLSLLLGKEYERIHPHLTVSAYFDGEFFNTTPLPVLEGEQQGTNHSHTYQFCHIDEEFYILFDRNELIPHPNPNKHRKGVTFIVKLNPGGQELGKLLIKLNAIRPYNLDRGYQEFQLGYSIIRLGLQITIMDIKDIPVGHVDFARTKANKSRMVIMNRLSDIGENGVGHYLDGEEEMGMQRVVDSQSGFYPAVVQQGQSQISQDLASYNGANRASSVEPDLTYLRRASPRSPRSPRQDLFYLKRNQQPQEIPNTDDQHIYGNNNHENGDLLGEQYRIDDSESSRLREENGGEVVQGGRSFLKKVNPAFLKPFRSRQQASRGAESVANRSESVNQQTDSEGNVAEDAMADFIPFGTTMQSTNNNIDLNIPYNVNYQPHPQNSELESVELQSFVQPPPQHAQNAQDVIHFSQNDLRPVEQHRQYDSHQQQYFDSKNMLEKLQSSPRRAQTSPGELQFQQIGLDQQEQQKLTRSQSQDGGQKQMQKEILRGQKSQELFYFRENGKQSSSQGQGLSLLQKNEKLDNENPVITPTINQSPQHELQKQSRQQNSGSKKNHFLAQRSRSLEEASLQKKEQPPRRQSEKVVGITQKNTVSNSVQASVQMVDKEVLVEVLKPPPKKRDFWAQVQFDQNVISRASSPQTSTSYENLRTNSSRDFYAYVQIRPRSSDMGVEAVVPTVDSGTQPTPISFVDCQTQISRNELVQYTSQGVQAKIEPSVVIQEKEKIVPMMLYVKEPVEKPDTQPIQFLQQIQYSFADLQQPTVPLVEQSAYSQNDKNNEQFNFLRCNKDKVVQQQDQSDNCGSHQISQSQESFHFTSQNQFCQEEQEHQSSSQNGKDSQLSKQCQESFNFLKQNNLPPIQQQFVQTQQDTNESHELPETCESFNFVRQQSTYPYISQQLKNRNDMQTQSSQNLENSNSQSTNQMSTQDCPIFVSSGDTQMQDDNNGEVQGQDSPRFIPSRETSDGASGTQSDSVNQNSPITFDLSKVQMASASTQVQTNKDASAIFQFQVDTQHDQLPLAQETQRSVSAPDSGIGSIFNLWKANSQGKKQKKNTRSVSTDGLPEIQENLVGDVKQQQVQQSRRVQVSESGTDMSGASQKEEEVVVREKLEMGVNTKSTRTIGTDPIESIFEEVPKKIPHNPNPPPPPPLPPKPYWIRKAKEYKTRMQQYESNLTIENVRVMREKYTDDDDMMYESEWEEGQQQNTSQKGSARHWPMNDDPMGLYTASRGRMIHPSDKLRCRSPTLSTKASTLQIEKKRGGIGDIGSNASEDPDKRWGLGNLAGNHDGMSEASNPLSLNRVEMSLEPREFPEHKPDWMSIKLRSTKSQLSDLEAIEKQLDEMDVEDVLLGDLLPGSVSTASKTLPVGIHHSMPAHSITPAQLDEAIQRRKHRRDTSQASLLSAHSQVSLRKITPDQQRKEEDGNTQLDGSLGWKVQALIGVFDFSKKGSQQK